MKSLPLAARWYLVVVWCVAAILIGHVLLSSPILLDQLPLLLLWIILFAFGDYFEVSIGISPEHRALLTITDTAMIFLVAVAGPLGLLVTALGTYFVGLLRRHLVLENALHYTGAFRAECAVRVQLVAEDDQVVCRVSDNGLGIAAEDLAHLGERFVRLASGVQAPEGTGLGLNFCTRLMALHGGALEIVSPGMGCGTTVVLRLPRAGAK